MKKITLWQRLNLALVLMILLLLGGFCVFFWTEKAGSESRRLVAELTNTKDKLRYDLAEADDAVRGILFDPKHELNSNRWRQANADLTANMYAAQSFTNRHPELSVPANALHDFVVKKLNPFHGHVLELAETNATEAIAVYNKTYGELREQRERISSDLIQQMEKVKSDETAGAEKIAIVGTALVAFLVLLSITVGFLHSSAVKKPLNLLISSLDRMRRGDFTERLAMNGRDEFGVLSDGLNRLADDLSDLVGQVQRSGIQVNTTATEIAATAKQQQTTAHEIAATTSEIGATSKEISATSKELVKTMNEVNHVAEETANLAGSGQSSIGRMESTMRQIMDASGSISAKLAVLSEKTANINSVVTTITKVADQTNLLSDRKSTR